VPGRITSSTPAKPATTASQRRAPIASPRTRPDSTVMSSGEEKKMALASTSESVRSAAKKLIVAPSSSSVRNRCSDGRRVRSRSSERRGSMSPKSTIAETA
jgi:hypothetical protein